MTRHRAPGFRSARGASQGRPRTDLPTPAGGRFATFRRESSRQVACQRVLLVAILCGAASAIAALAQWENPSFLTDRQRERWGVPRAEAVVAQEALPAVVQCSDTTGAESEPLADALTRWADALEAGLAVDDGGQVLESVNWPEQLEMLRRAAVVVGTEERIDAMGSAHDPERPAEDADTVDSDEEWRPTFAGLFLEPEAEAQVFAYVSDVQVVAAEIARQCPGAQAAHVRIVAQEFARLRVVEPSHPAVTQRYRMITILCRESGCRPDARNPHSTAMGLFQFLDSTCRWFGADPARMRGTSPDDIRYQCRKAFALLAQCGWSQWEADPGRDGRDGEAG
jgi:hypothetical protein